MSNGATRRTLTIFACITTPALAEPAGPPAPVAAKRTPAELAISVYDRTYSHSIANTTCAPTRGSDIVVCGNGRSPDRLPLPEERGPRDWARMPTGEIPRAGGGGSPVGQSGIVGVTVNVLALAGKADAPVVVAGEK